MIRKIITIDEEKCDGCGLCVEACHEGAIALVGGKAKLVRDDYCDGLGNCLPVCPKDAISFIEREAAAFDEKAVEENMKRSANANKPVPPPAIAKNAPPAKLACGCPGTNSKLLKRGGDSCCQDGKPETAEQTSGVPSRLIQWPVQIKLVPVNAGYFNGANLLVAADCSAYAYGDFHARFIKNRVTLIGCPKLDEGDYTEKLTAILKNNDIKSLTVTRMEVPCCGGIERAAINALKASGKFIPWQIVTISTDGQIIDQ